MKVYFIDAFADALFTGNPAAVCYCEKPLDCGTMQKIAAEHNLSETAFLVKEKQAYSVRWFTPKYEIDLCGHATLASAFAIRNFIEPNASSISFSSVSGELTVEYQNDLYTLNFPARPMHKIDVPRELENALGAAVRECYLSRDIVAVVQNQTEIQNLRPDFSRLNSLTAGDGVIVTAQGEDCDFVSRCFYPKCGVNEDPVTGSAHCNLIPYWANRLQKKKMFARQLSKRGGKLYCEHLGERVLIGGKAVLYSVAELCL